MPRSPTAHAVVKDLTGNLEALTAERAGLTDLQANIHGEIAGLDGLDHLERPDFLDRITIVRGEAGGLMRTFWTAIGAVFSVLQLGVALLLLGTVNPWLIPLVVFAAAPLWFDQRGQRAIVHAETASAEAFRLQRHLFELATSAVSAKEIVATGIGGRLTTVQGAASADVTRLRLRARVTAACWQAGGWLLFTAGFIGGLLIVVQRVSVGQASAGDVVLAITLSISLRQSVHDALSRVTETALSGRIIEPLLWLRDYAAADRVRTAGDRQPPAVLRQGITLDRVSYTYPGASRPTLTEISAHLPAGAVVAVVGEYGSGKTTLVKLLNKFHQPDCGTISVDGIDLAVVDTTRWRQRTAGAFQDFGRFKTTFAEAVGLGDLDRVNDRAAIEAAVAEADAVGLVARLPQGLDTQLGHGFGGVDLSEGQWQKTALARAVMRRDPLLFVMDEPTASLDAPSEQEIFERYMRRARAIGDRTGAVTVIVSHRFSTVTSADLILVLHNGELVEAGTHRKNCSPVMAATPNCTPCRPPRTRRPERMRPEADVSVRPHPHVAHGLTSPRAARAPARRDRRGIARAARRCACGRLRPRSSRRTLILADDSGESG